LELPQAVASEVAEGRSNVGPWLTFGFGPMAWTLVPHVLEQRVHATWVPPLPHVEGVSPSGDHRKMRVGSSWFCSVRQAQPLEPGWACNRALLRHANMTHTGVATNSMIMPERASSMLTTLAKLDTCYRMSVSCHEDDAKSAKHGRQD